ncbi:hypothetical protein U9M73_07930 [Paenibacillus phoenicis]|uniref:Uncharacterized protein n=1 Tax=Paenibacillus phoenicis TaxID=554117 RepID=A0ABU5PJ10_9BACL|nr:MULTISPECIES: hypothetical protein [Paenibacillus]EES72293.1 hypothetical protein POTG_03133 [Paenibacillus sp. oral taxon 786 str. D14]MEA3569928.1 hypothetical protein [Paenibacillus phoenicis]
MIRKNNTKFEMLFSLGFLALLITAFGTFFLGLNLGIDKTEAKYANLKAITFREENETSYQQQDLVTFYYVVFQPYQQFKEDYLTLIEDITHSSKPVSSDKLKDIRDKAKASYEQIAVQSIADSSPLLKEAQTDYLKSLKLFEESMDQIKSKAGNKKGMELAKIINQDEFTVNAKKYGLQAQKKYYASMLKWTAKTKSGVSADYTYKENIGTKEWSGYSLAVKNKAVTDMMVNEQLYVSYLPQDFTAKIDQLISSGKADALKLNSIGSIVKVLIETDAVKSKEFVKWKSTYYASESLPELPFFAEN